MDVKNTKHPVIGNYEFEHNEPHTLAMKLSLVQDRAGDRLEILMLGTPIKDTKHDTRAESAIEAVR